MLDNAAIQSKEKQGQLDAARLSVVEQEGKRNLLEAEVASLQSEVTRLNAVTAPAAPVGLYTSEQLHTAIESTVIKDKEHFDEQLADQMVKLENEHREQVREYEDRVVQWTETAQEWKERSDGQAIDVAWWESFGEAFPEQLARFEQQGGEPVAASAAIEPPIQKQSPGLTTFGDTISRMHQACIKQVDPSPKQAFKLDSAVSRLTTNTIAAGATGAVLPETRSLITGESMTSMVGGTRAAGGDPGQTRNTAPSGGGQPPGPPAGLPPGLTPRGAAANAPELAIDPTRLLMMSMGGGNRLQVPKWPHVAQLPQWLIQLGKNLVSISPYNDCAEIKWLQDVKEKSFEELADSGATRFQKMDLKMATEMQSAYKDADGALRLMQEIQILDEDITNKGGMLKGRQYTKLILEHFKTDRSLDKAWQVEDLFGLEYPGDARLQQFRYLWHKIVLCLQGEISTDQLRKLLRRRLGNSKVLKEDIAHYDRQEGIEGSKEHTYDYLLDCMDRYLRRTGVQQNQQEHEKIFELQMKALKDGKNLTPAQLAQQLNVTPAKGAKGGGKSPKGGKALGRDEKGGGAATGAKVCWHHNAKHHYPDGSSFCPARIDEATGKTTCWFSHTIVSRKDFDEMPVPRSVGKSGGKGGNAGGKNPRGSSRRPESVSGG